MKTLLSFIFFCLVLVIFISCGEGISPIGGEILPKIDTFDCPQPKRQPDGSVVSAPSKSHKLQRVSPDGREIAYVVNENIIKIINVKTGIVETYIPNNMMDSNVNFNGCFDLRWCPYNNNTLCFMFVTAIDTLGGGGRKKYGQNLFILNRKESKFNRIDLPFVSKAGPESLSLYGWFTNPAKLIDSLFIGYSTNSSTFRGIVVLQEMNITPVAEFNRLRSLGFVEDFTYSPDHLHIASLLQQVKVPPYGSIIYIDGIPLEFPGDTLDLLHKTSWSPDGKKLAVTLRLGSLYRTFHETVWVIDVEKWLRERPTYAPVEKIDFQKRFCMYNFGGGPIDAEFITNTTLAVSCHHDGDMLCPLWEITTDGRLLRQITHDD